eukprot:CAMPEP_0179179882 /NCGR_PEP_ID=MMETSP0796-20121207/89031_1 /TAXON_ID=73915 /ORGANISM="Pyrodinium bahamense, Strain pbaha01" /LENGTH=63 /DNA_ID=CAMNT_0020883551 /DNA_START=37 /DNA_END=224 /DNA_ORIENTATION=-
MPPSKPMPPRSTIFFSSLHGAFMRAPRRELARPAPSNLPVASWMRGHSLCAATVANKVAIART